MHRRRRAMRAIAAHVSDNAPGSGMGMARMSNAPPPSAMSPRCAGGGVEAFEGGGGGVGGVQDTAVNKQAPVRSTGVVARYPRNVPVVLS